MMEGANPVTQVVLPLAAALTLFAIGLGLTVDDLRRVWLRPRAFVLGAVAHVVLLPAVAFGVALLLDLQPTVAVGLAVIAACPANAASNVLTLLAGGDTMLSICLTALTSLGAALTIPLVVNLALATFLPGSAEVSLPVLPAALGLFAISTVPVLAGMWARGRWPAFARAVEARLAAILLVVIVVLITAVVVTEWRNVGPALAEAGIAALLLNVGAVAVAWTAAAVARVGRAQRVAIGLECGLQNFGLAAFVTLTMMEDARFLVAGIAYGLVMWLSAAAVVLLARPRAAVIAASLLLLVVAGAAPVPAAPTATLVRGPYLQRGTQTSGIVRFRTDLAEVGWVAWGPSGEPLATLLQGASATTEHRLQITGLAAGTRYDYAVGSGVAQLATGSFRTAPATPTDTVRIWAVGDVGVDSANSRAVRDAYLAFTAGSPADFWLLLGDNAYTSGTDAEYQTGFFVPFAPVLDDLWLWPVLGNHDAISADSATLTGPYFSNFSLPRSGEAGGEPSGTEAFYSFDWGPLLHVIVLDSADSSLAVGGPMYQWLVADLARPRGRFTIAAWHHPPYTKGSHDSDNLADSGGRMAAMRENFLPLLEAAGVDLVLAGHSHGYERSWYLAGHYGFSPTFDGATMKRDAGDGDPSGAGSFVRGAPAERGTVYAVPGSGAFATPSTYDHPAMLYGEARLGALVIDVTTDHLDARFLDTTGTVRDHFRILARELLVDDFESADTTTWQGN